MRNLKLIAISLLILVGLTSYKFLEPSKKYKCMIQMKDYSGEGAYVIVSLINPEKQYEKTLFVFGKDEDWYNEITNWWGYYGKKRYNIDGITGATLAGSKSRVSIIELDDSKLNTGYSIRFETSVEDQKYYTKDLEFLLTTESVRSKKEGSGYINFVRLIPSN